MSSSSDRLSKFGIVDVSSFSKGPSAYNGLSLLRADRYDRDTLILVRQGSNATLFKLTLEGYRSAFGGNLALTHDDARAGTNEGQQFRYILDVAQYNNTKIAFAEYWPDHCVKEYDSATDQITNLVGSCNESQWGSALSSPGKPVIAKEHHLGTPTSLLLLEATQKLLIIDGSYNITYIYDFPTATLELFVPKFKLAVPQSLLASTDESVVYVSHHFAVTAVRVRDRETTRLVGKNSIDGSDIFSPGPFSAESTHIGSLSFLRWVIPDKLMFASHGKSLAIIDLVDQQVFSICKGEY